MRIAVLSSIALAASVLVGASQAAIVYDNGPIGVDSNWCDSGFGQCAGGSSWTIVDNFSLSSKSVVTGFDTWNAYGHANEYVSTNWRIWSSQPDGTTAPLASGSAVADISSDVGFILASVSGLSVSLDAGNYWIGFSHALTGNTPWTYVTSLSGERDALQLNDYTNSVNRSSMYDAAFRIHATAAVPEPGSIALVFGGLAVLVGATRRRSGSL